MTWGYSCTPFDTIMVVVHQRFHIQLDSFSDQPIEMMSKCFEKTTNVFLFESASCEYLTLSNRSPNNGVMTVLLKDARNP